MACYEVTFIHFYLHNEDVGLAECHHVFFSWTLEVHVLKILLQILNWSKIFHRHLLPSTCPLFVTTIKLKSNIRLQKDRTVRLMFLLIILGTDLQILSN